MRLSAIFRPYVVRGLVVGLGIVAIGYLLILTYVVVNYDGRCGIGFPLGVRPPCSFSAYVWDSATLLLAVATGAWWILLIVIMVPAIVAHLIGKRRTNA